MVDALVFYPWSVPCRTGGTRLSSAPSFSLGQTVGLMPDCGLLFVASGVMTQMAGPLKPLTEVLSWSIVKAALFDLPLIPFEIRPPSSRAEQSPVVGDFARRQMKEWKQTHCKGNYFPLDWIHSITHSHGFFYFCNNRNDLPQNVLLEMCLYFMINRP